MLLRWLVRVHLAVCDLCYEHSNLPEGDHTLPTSRYKHKRMKPTLEARVCRLTVSSACSALSALRLLSLRVRIVFRMD